MQKNLILSGFLLLMLVSCAEESVHTKVKSNPREYQLGAYLWQQNSGEYQALCYQAYNLAKMLLASDLENKHNKKRAVIFDIDETIFNNSFLGAKEIKNGLIWSKDSLSHWVKEQKAEAIAGAKEFIDYAVANKVEVFYVSDRATNEIDDTYDNFKKLNIPAKKENFYFMDGTWSKEPRRAMIQKKYDVVLYFGDNLHDFDSAWDNKTSEMRKKIVDDRRQEFGQHFIILPNPLYGDWENSLPKNKDRMENLIIKP